MKSFSLCLLSSLAMLASIANAGDWPRFRGPNGSGIAPDSQPVPTSWSPDSNVLWSKELPGPGVSSPIVVGDRVFVTCYSGYGVRRGKPGNIKDLKRHLVCFHARSGRTVWQRNLKAKQPEDPYTGMGVPTHGYASHTPASDGEFVYAFFGKSGVYAFDLDGNQVWHTDVGSDSDPWQWGSASSPIVVEDLVIVPAIAESQSLVALDKKTGDVVWKQKAGGFDGSWSTPVVVDTKEGTKEIVVNVPGELWAFRPSDGELLWYALAHRGEQVHSSPVVVGDLIYAFVGRGGGSAAVRAGGTKDVTNSHVVWTGNDSARFASPVYYQDRIYLIANGVLSVIDPKTGERVSQTRLPLQRNRQAIAGGGQGGRGGGARGGAGGAGGGAFGGAGGAGGAGGRGYGGRGGAGGAGGRPGAGFGALDFASPVIAQRHLYYTVASGETYVFELGKEVTLVNTNRVTNDQETFAGTPAISMGRIFLRSNKRLYCVGVSE